MHLIFIPYGKRSEVELLLRDMEAQKHFLHFQDIEGKDILKGVYIQGQIRFLPFGFYEYVFPKEDLEIVLNSLDCGSVPYEMNFVSMFARKFLKCKRIPKYKKDKNFLWIRDNVSIIPIGIREDKIFFDEKVNAYHEGI